MGSGEQNARGRIREERDEAGCTPEVSGPRHHHHHPSHALDNTSARVTRAGPGDDGHPMRPTPTHPTHGHAPQTRGRHLTTVLPQAATTYPTHPTPSHTRAPDRQTDVNADAGWGWETTTRSGLTHGLQKVS